jgi:hypothetical protein
LYAVNHSLATQYFLPTSTGRLITIPFLKIRPDSSAYPFLVLHQLNTEGALPHILQISLCSFKHPSGVSVLPSPFSEPRHSFSPKALGIGARDSGDMTIGASAERNRGGGLNGA